MSVGKWQQQVTNDNQRRGLLVTRKGSLQTPFFMPDATRATVRGLSSDTLTQIGLEALVVNTYHLMLQPGASLVEKAGGIHSFMHWDKPVLSDSGGYQVFSLIHKNPELGRITEEGAEFRSIIDGSKHLLTPERAIQIQFDLGVDMMVCLDDPRPNEASEQDIIEAVDRTIRWAQRCRDEFDRQILVRGLNNETRPMLFGVVQGGMMVGERKRCADGLIEIGFDGYGLGGRHVDTEGKFLGELMASLASFIPEDKVRFALGVGKPEDIVRLYAVGWDMFDCVIPTREGRHGRLFLWKSKNTNFNPPTSGTKIKQNIKAYNEEDDSFYTTINIHNEQFTEDFTPVDATCDCTLCTQYTRAYLKHLFRVEESLGFQLASEHNLRFYMKLMEKLRA
ncbi:MAG: tRNA guanosine(34) transglycosylase Tgt [Candidatus Moranbacteria bacterium]|nr:tRNA guanosine(34) transglycosylase Tgt [Candidatus Moranbacteria bacterium]MDD3964505.1 tRNA guanosine(34) transglycosylase Tgt [Candidatus Moranbacteria bacterium]